MNPLDQLNALPETLVGEILAGQLYTQPRPRPRHAVAIGGLYSGLRPLMDESGGWVFLIEPELHLGADVVVPDVCGWRRERFVLPETAFFEAVPDWVCEVLSPSSAAHDRGRKMDFYLSAGVKHCWLVDPGAQTVEVFQAGVHWEFLGVFTETVQMPPFQEVGIELAGLWAP